MFVKLNQKALGGKVFLLITNDQCSSAIIMALLFRIYMLQTFIIDLLWLIERDIQYLWAAKYFLAAITSSIDLT